MIFLRNFMCTVKGQFFGLVECDYGFVVLIKQPQLIDLGIFPLFKKKNNLQDKQTGKGSRKIFHFMKFQTPI